MKGRFIITQNFEQNLTQAIQEVVASIDPNYTFDKERNCYVAVREIEPFLKPDKKAGFDRNDYRSPLESDNKDKSGTHITSMFQLSEPDEFFELDKKSDYTELIKNRLPQEEPDNDDDLDLPF